MRNYEAVRVCWMCIVLVLGARHALAPSRKLELSYIVEATNTTYYNNKVVGLL
jgi:hypothetical protein